MVSILLSLCINLVLRCLYIFIYKLFRSKSLAGFKFTGDRPYKEIIFDVCSVLCFKQDGVSSATQGCPPESLVDVWYGLFAIPIMLSGRGSRLQPRRSTKNLILLLKKRSEKGGGEQFDILQRNRAKENPRRQKHVFRNSRFCTNV